MNCSHCDLDTLGHHHNKCPARFDTLNKHAMLRPLRGAAGRLREALVHPLVVERHAVAGAVLPR